MTISKNPRGEVQMDEDYIKSAQKALEEIKRKAAQGKFISSFRVGDHDDNFAVFQHFLIIGDSPVVRWQIEQAQVVQAISLKEAVHSAADRRRAIRNTYPKDCYRNAIKVSKKLGAMYCEGWGQSVRYAVDPACLELRE